MGESDNEDRDDDGDRAGDEPDDRAPEEDGRYEGGNAVVAAAHVGVLSVASGASDAAVQLVAKLVEYDSAVLSCVSHANARSLIFVDPN